MPYGQSRDVHHDQKLSTTPEKQSTRNLRGTLTHRIHLWRNIPRRPTNLNDRVQLILLDNSAEPKVGDHDLGIVVGGVEEEVLGL